MYLHQKPDWEKDASPVSAQKLSKGPEVLRLQACVKCPWFPLTEDKAVLSALGHLL